MKKFMDSTAQAVLRPKKILIIKLRYIGDTLSLLPVIENLSVKAPQILVDVMVNKGTEEVVAYHPGVRKTLAYDRKLAKKDLLSSISYHLKLIRGLRAEKYDCVIDYTFGDRTAFVAFMTGARHRITYEDSSTLSHILMNHMVYSDPSKNHVVDRQLKALTLLGLDGFDRSMKLHVPPEVHRKVDRMIQDRGIGDSPRKVIIHPGARKEVRRWRPERFAEIGKLLKETYEAAIILVGGPDEGELLHQVESLMGFPPALSVSNLTLLEMAALMHHADLFIGNDTGPGHIAAAVGCPTLTLFGPNFPHLWRPIGARTEVVFKELPCCGCMHEMELCVRPDNTCMDLIQTEEVWQKAVKLLETP